MSRVLGRNELPGAPAGERVLLLQDPPKSASEYGIHIPDVAQRRPSTGVLLDAGLQALDKLHDAGIEIGDHVIWGQFAGVIYEWDHIHSNGSQPCEHEGSWTRLPSPRDRASAFKCEKCEAVRWVEALIIANVDDIQVSEDLAARRRAGKMRYKRGTSGEDKRTTFYIEREGAE